MRKRGAADPTVLAEVVIEGRREREEQAEAQIAALSCEISLDAVRIGLKNTVLGLRKPPKSKYQYNKERKRDFRMNKATSAAKQEKTGFDLAAEELERTGKVSYHLLETDPPAFYRNYQHQVYQTSLKQIHRSFPSFRNIQKLDFSQQLLGDERLDSLCDALRGNPTLSSLNLSGNKLTDQGLLSLARVQRSLSNLKMLNLSWNVFGDKGVSDLMHRDAYSPSLLDLDLSYNHLTAKTAYHLGMIFQPDCHSVLSALRLGGVVGREGWGDHCLQVLIHLLTQGDLSRLALLHIPDFAISDEGWKSLLGWIVSDRLRVKSLNISKNPLPRPALRRAWLQAVRLQSQSISIIATDCCFSREELHYLTSIGPWRFTQEEEQKDEGMVRWHRHGRWEITREDRLRLAYLALQGLNTCEHSHRTVRQDVLNIWRTVHPLSWQSFKQSYPSDLITNLRAALSVKGFDDLFYLKETRQMLLFVNDACIEAYSLQDLLEFIELSVKDIHREQLPKTIQNSSEIQAVIDNIEFSQAEYDRWKTKHTERMPKWSRSAEQLLQTAMNVQEIIVSTTRPWSRHSSRPSAEQESLYFALEDVLARVIDFADIVQNVIGRVYEMRLLRLTLAQLALSNTGPSSSSSSSSSSSATMTYKSILQKKVHCYDTIGIMALFSQYAYLIYHKDKSDQAEAERQLQQQT